MSEAGKRTPSPAMIVALIALFIALGGSALAARGALRLGKNSVGTRQLKAKAVTSPKIAPNAITSAKVANGALTGADINFHALGTVPEATHAQSADSAGAVGGHAASCPANTTLIRGICFDATSNPAASTLQQASDACAQKGGYLPTPMELYSTRGILNLGTGVGSDHQYTDEIYANTAGVNYSTVVIDGTGAITEQSISTPSKYTCAYPLVR